MSTWCLPSGYVDLSSQPELARILKELDALTKSAGVFQFAAGRGADVAPNIQYSYYIRVVNLVEVKHIQTVFLLPADTQVAIFGIRPDGEHDLANQSESEALLLKSLLCLVCRADETISERPGRPGFQFKQLVEGQRVRLRPWRYQVGDALNARWRRLDLADGLAYSGLRKS